MNFSRKELLYSDEGWKYCTGPELRGHILNVHYMPRMLERYGVAKDDVDIALRRGFDLSWLVEKVYGLLERSDEEILPTLKDTQLTPASYRNLLVQNLQYIDGLGLTNIDWARVR